MANNDHPISQLRDSGKMTSDDLLVTAKHLNNSAYSSKSINFLDVSKSIINESTTELSNFFTSHLSIIYGSVGEVLLRDWEVDLKYYLNVTAGSNGRVNPSGSLTKTENLFLLTATANSGYHFGTWTTTTPGITILPDISASAITASVQSSEKQYRLTANFEKDPAIVLDDSNTTVSIRPDSYLTSGTATTFDFSGSNYKPNDITVQYGVEGSPKTTLRRNTDYDVAWKHDGDPQWQITGATVVGTTYTANPAPYVSINGIGNYSGTVSAAYNVNYVKLSYTPTYYWSVSLPSNGSITPEGTQTSTSQSMSFTCKPNANYYVADFGGHTGEVDAAVIASFNGSRYASSPTIVSAEISQALQYQLFARVNPSSFGSTMSFSKSEVYPGDEITVTMDIFSGWMVSDKKEHVIQYALVNAAGEKLLESDIGDVPTWTFTLPSSKLTSRLWVECVMKKNLKSAWNMYMPPRPMVNLYNEVNGSVVESGVVDKDNIYVVDQATSSPIYHCTFSFSPTSTSTKTFYYKDDDGKWQAGKFLKTEITIHGNIQESDNSPGYYGEQLLTGAQEGSTPIKTEFYVIT